MARTSRESLRTNVFDDLANGARRMDYAPRTLEAQKYYQRKARELRGISASAIIRSGDSDKQLVRVPNMKSVIGHMVLFQYDPKHKATLPYYDRHPLVFILKPLKDGFLGINFHYLPYKWRGILLNRLTEIANNKNYDEETKIVMTYAILNNSARYAPFKPCLKRYLASHVESKFLWIPSYDWEIAIFLPVQQFVGASDGSVWAKSMNKFGKQKR